MRERSESNQVSESKGTTEFFVYILRCSDGSYYVGSTQDVDRRVKVHNDGNAAVYTRLRRPVELAYTEPCESETVAVRRERQIKRWSRAKKEALILGDKGMLHVLSRRRQ
jgi:predicted GIY-YIG superfamily endonuclease